MMTWGICIESDMSCLAILIAMGGTGVTVGSTRDTWTYLLPLLINLAKGTTTTAMMHSGKGFAGHAVEPRVS